MGGLDTQLLAFRNVMLYRIPICGFVKSAFPNNVNNANIEWDVLLRTRNQFRILEMLKNFGMSHQIILFL